VFAIGARVGPARTDAAARAPACAVLCCAAAHLAVVDLAISYSMGQAAPLVAMGWGVLYYGEFSGASQAAYTALAVMVVLCTYICVHGPQRTSAPDVSCMAQTASQLVSLPPASDRILQVASVSSEGLFP
jgi:hypothetical protein